MAYLAFPEGGGALGPNGGYPFFSNFVQKFHEVNKIDLGCVCVVPIHTLNLHLSFYLPTIFRIAWPSSRKALKFYFVAF